MHNTLIIVPHTSSSATEEELISTTNTTTSTAVTVVTRGAQHSLSMYTDELFSRRALLSCSCRGEEEEEDDSEEETEEEDCYHISLLWLEEQPTEDDQEEEEEQFEWSEEDLSLDDDREEEEEGPFRYTLGSRWKHDDAEGQEEEQRRPNLNEFPELPSLERNGDEREETLQKKEEPTPAPIASPPVDNSHLIPSYPALHRQMEQKREEDALLGTAASSGIRTDDDNESFDQRPKQVHPLMAEAIKDVCVGEQWMKVSKRAQMQKLMRDVAAAVQDTMKEQKRLFPSSFVAPKSSAPVTSLEFLAWLLTETSEGVNGYGNCDRLVDHLVHCATRNGESENEARRAFDGLIELEDSKKLEVVVALHIIASLSAEEESGNYFISALAVRIFEHLNRCRPARLQAIPLVIKIGGQMLLDSSSSSPTGNDETSSSLSSSEEQLSRYKELCEAKERLHSIFEEYIDDHKEAAIRTGIIEAAEYGNVVASDGYGARHVEANGRCWYLTAVVEGFGGPSALELPVPVLAGEDMYQIGVRFMWESIDDKEKEALHDPKHFGVSGFRKIPVLKNGAENIDDDRDTPRATHYYSMERFVKEYFRNEDANDHHLREIQGWAKTVKEGFVFYFSDDFFVRRCFETLNSESRPEYAGFRAMCIRVFQFFPRCQPEGSISRFADPEDADDEPSLSLEERFNEFCYSDEYCAELDLENVKEFMAWLGFLRNPMLRAAQEGERLETLQREEMLAVERSERAEIMQFIRHLKQLECARHFVLESEKASREGLETEGLSQLKLLLEQSVVERRADTTTTSKLYNGRSLRKLILQKKILPVTSQ